MDRVLDHHMEPMTVDIFKFPRQFPGFHFYSWMAEFKVNHTVRAWMWISETCVQHVNHHKAMISVGKPKIIHKGVAIMQQKRLVFNIQLYLALKKVKAI